MTNANTNTNPVEICHNCTHRVGQPWRTHDSNGNIVDGCVDESHTGHLDSIASAAWHHRPAAVKIREDIWNARYPA